MAKRFYKKKKSAPGTHPYGKLPITPIANSDAEFIARTKSGPVISYTLTKEEIALRYPPKRKEDAEIKEVTIDEIYVATSPEAIAEVPEVIIKEEILHIY